jgi:ABC-type branched-subunit amino acid transport system ATPase component
MKANASPTEKDRARVRAAPPADGVVRISVDRVSKYFGGVRALVDVSLEAPPGRITGIIGPNGAGKSTLFNVVTGVLKPDAGRVTIAGRELTGMPPHRIAQASVGRTFQTARGFPSLSILDNLLVAPDDGAQGLFASLVGRKIKKETADRALAVLERIGLRQKMEVPFAALSGGEARLLEIGRQLMREPTYILLDEPTAGVAPEFQGRLADLMTSLRDEGSVLICVEHNMRFLRRLADEVVVLVQGRVVTSGPATEVFRHPDVIEAYLGKRTHNA